jgi:hypothetical protein
MNAVKAAKEIYMNDTPKPTLKPCPMCGGEAHEVNPHWNMAHAECKDCEAQWGHCGSQYKGRYEKFNTRPEPTKPQIEAVARALKYTAQKMHADNHIHKLNPPIHDMYIYLAKAALVAAAEVSS